MSAPYYKEVTHQPPRSLSPARAVGVGSLPPSYFPKWPPGGIGNVRSDLAGRQCPLRSHLPQFLVAFPDSASSLHKNSHTAEAQPRANEPRRSAQAACRGTLSLTPRVVFPTAGFGPYICSGDADFIGASEASREARGRRSEKGGDCARSREPALLTVSRTRTVKPPSAPFLSLQNSQQVPFSALVESNATVSLRKKRLQSTWVRNTLFRP